MPAGRAYLLRGCTGCSQSIPIPASWIHLRFQGDKAMRGKTIGCVMGSLGLLLGAGAAWGNQQMDTTAGSDSSAKASDMAAGKPECRDAGVTVAFKTGSAELDQNARGALDGVATW